jgi:hypothetical protein
LIANGIVGKRLGIVQKAVKIGPGFGRQLVDGVVSIILALAIAIGRVARSEHGCDGRGNPCCTAESPSA